MPGGMWDEAARVYPMVGAKANQNDLDWTFPGGARVSFRHLQYETTKQIYQGAQIVLLAFDQLEHFTESQFMYMLSRNRSTSGIRPYVRATCNPDAGSWLRRFVDWWIAPDGYADMDKAGVLRWFTRDGDKVIWADRPDAFGTGITPKSVTYIPASVYDNKILMQADPGYLANLQALNLLDRERLLGDPRRGGNWNILPAAGKVFNRSWFEIVEAAPAGGAECRFWDMAATVKENAGDDPDYTASVHMRRVDGVYYIIDVTEERLGPAAVDRAMLNTSKQDAGTARKNGARYAVRWEIEPGSAGIRENRRMVRMLAGLDARGRKAAGEKLVRAKPLAAQAEAGNVKIVAGPWVESFLTHMHNQPDWPHDDVMDAASGAFAELAGDMQMQTSNVNFYAPPARETKRGSAERTADEVEALLNG